MDKEADGSSYSHKNIKLVGTFVLLALCMLLGCAPLRFHHKSPRLLISLANCFAGGVFFSTVMLDLIPEVEEKVQEALVYAKIDTEFSLGAFIIGVGFMCMLFLEHMVHSCCHNRIVQVEDVESKAQAVDNKAYTTGCDASYCKNSDRLNLAEAVHSHGGAGHHQSSGPETNFGIYVLIFAISLHSIFEGLATGLITKPSQLYQIYVALLIHKSVIAFSIGVQLIDAKLKKKVHLICITIFSVMTPIGVGFGLLVLNSFETGLQLFFSGVLQALATGTFLYVTFFEVLPHELSSTVKDGKKTLKICFVVLGFLLVTGSCAYESGFHELKKPGNDTLLVGL